jgi:hypothetical protein
MATTLSDKKLNVTHQRNDSANGQGIVLDDGLQSSKHCVCSVLNGHYATCISTDNIDILTANGNVIFLTLP